MSDASKSRPSPSIATPLVAREQRPVRIALTCLGACRGIGAGFVGIDIGQIGIERFELVGSAGIAGKRARHIGGLRLFRGDALGLGFAAFVAFKQRIAFEFALDKGLQFEIGHLQQLDRLLQLRRHHQGLSLA